MNMKMNRMSPMYFYMIALVIVVAILYVLYDGFFKAVLPYGKRQYKASSPHADVIFATNENEDTINIHVTYKDLTGISAIHIHVNDNGKPAQIIAWLGTTVEWQRGVAQNTPGSNLPCCVKANPMCNLAAPSGTPYLSDLQNSQRSFTVKKCDLGKGCPWLENGVLLDLHGFHFQQIVDGVKTNEAPGADIVESIKFTSHDV